MVIVYNFLRDRVFSKNLRKANIFPVHKKGTIQSLSNYRPVSILSNCSKISEKMIFDCIYDILDQNCLLKANQSGFRPDDSWIHQLIAIINNVFTAFDANSSLKVRGIFRNLS